MIASYRYFEKNEAKLNLIVKVVNCFLMRLCLIIIAAHGLAATGRWAFKVSTVDKLSCLFKDT